MNLRLPMTLCLFGRITGSYLRNLLVAKDGMPWPIRLGLYRIWVAPFKMYQVQKPWQWSKYVEFAFVLPSNSFRIEVYSIPMIATKINPFMRPWGILRNGAMCLLESPTIWSWATHIIFEWTITWTVYVNTRASKRNVMGDTTKSKRSPPWTLGWQRTRTILVGWVLKYVITTNRRAKVINVVAAMSALTPTLNFQAQLKFYRL